MTIFDGCELQFPVQPYYSKEELMDYSIKRLFSSNAEVTFDIF